MLNGSYQPINQIPNELGKLMTALPPTQVRLPDPFRYLSSHACLCCLLPPSVNQGFLYCRPCTLSVAEAANPASKLQSALGCLPAFRVSVMPRSRLARLHPCQTLLALCRRMRARP